MPRWLLRLALVIDGNVEMKITFQLNSLLQRKVKLRKLFSIYIITFIIIAVDYMSRSWSYRVENNNHENAPIWNYYRQVAISELWSNGQRGGLKVETINLYWLLLNLRPEPKGDSREHRSVYERMSNEKLWLYRDMNLSRWKWRVEFHRWHGLKFYYFIRVPLGWWEEKFNCFFSYTNLYMISYLNCTNVNKIFNQKLCLFMLLSLLKEFQRN